jgi:hypothetical protein
MSFQNCQDEFDERKRVKKSLPVAICFFSGWEDSRLPAAQDRGKIGRDNHAAARVSDSQKCPAFKSPGFSIL